MLEILSYLCKANIQSPALPERRRERSETERERPIKMPPSFSLHSSLVSPREFIWWQTIPTPPPVCTHTHTRSCISSIKMIHSAAPRGWHFSKWGMMPVKNSRQWHPHASACVFLIYVCSFPLLLHLGIVGVRFSASDPSLSPPPSSPSIILLYSPSSSPPSRPIHWSLSAAYLYSSLNLSLNSFSLFSSPRCFLRWCYLSWEDTHTHKREHICCTWIRKQRQTLSLHIGLHLLELTRC